MEAEPGRGIVEPKMGRGNIVGFDVTHKADEPSLLVCQGQ